MMFRILGSARLPAGELPTCPGELHAHGEGLPCPKASMAPLRALLELGANPLATTSARWACADAAVHANHRPLVADLERVSELRDWARDLGPRAAAAGGPAARLAVSQASASFFIFFLSSKIKKMPEVDRKLRESACAERVCT